MSKLHQFHLHFLTGGVAVVSFSSGSVAAVCCVLPVLFSKNSPMVLVMPAGNMLKVTHQQAASDLGQSVMAKTVLSPCIVGESMCSLRHFLLYREPRSSWQNCRTWYVRCQSWRSGILLLWKSFSRQPCFEMCFIPSASLYTDTHKINMTWICSAKNCQAYTLNREDAMDCGRWKKLMKDSWWSG